MDLPEVLEPAGRTATGIEVPEEVLEALGAGRRPPVTVTLGRCTFRTMVGSAPSTPCPSAGRGPWWFRSSRPGRRDAAALRVGSGGFAPPAELLATPPWTRSAR